MDKLHLNTLNGVNKNIEAIEELFPHCVTEVKNDDGELVKVVDFDLLKQELSHALVDGEKERYRLTWPGKREALLEANLPTAKSLRPCRKESVDFDSAQNLFIEGDNLEALKLLQESYLGKVKMIYIDPPYNTGKDFIYRDKFKASKEDYLRDSGQTDEAGNRLMANTEANGRFHSDWLSMMYPRLKLARNLLRDDGVIFISIDDNEVHNIRLLMNGVFGDKNLEQMVWRKSGISRDGKMKNTTTFRNDHEYLVVAFKTNKLLNKSFEKPNWKNSYGNLDSDIRGNYKAGSISKREEASDPQNKNYYTVISPSGRKITRQFEISKEEFDKLNLDNRIYWGKNGDAIPALKIFESEKREVTTSSLIDDRDATTTKGSKEINEIFDSSYDLGGAIRPKPINLLKKLIQIGSNSDDLILDFFAGSCTTAHAVLELNKEDGGNRRYIMVQLQEPCDEKSQAFKQGYKTVADIGKERIRRAAKKIKEDCARENKQPKLIDETPKRIIESLDIGFRVLKVASSSRREVDSVPDKVKQLEIPVAIDNIKEDRSDEDILFQVLLSWGVDLSLPITVERILGLDVFCVDGNSLVACFAKNGEVGDGVCNEIAKKEPLRVVFRDAGFKDDDAKINAEQIFKLKSPKTEIKVI